MSVHVFGIRHHGPGSARSLVMALDQLEPDAVLVEGPPDATPALRHLADEGMKPPVALLVYPPGSPSEAAYYPFTDFSPEWQALRWAQKHGVEAAFMDLPLTHRMALDAAKREADADSAEDGATDGAVEFAEAPGEGAHVDPLGVLAEAAGYDDGESWWDQHVEARQDATGVFEAILVAMAAVREDAPDPSRAEALREAYMRKILRATLKAGHDKVAVVCGAWHAPVLAKLPPAKADNAVLKGLPKTKVAATWIPWTHSRLSYRSGYGAGVESPGWYQHVWERSEQATVRWTAQAAALLREQDLDASSASVIEAVRLAEALAALRERSAPGLQETREAIQTVLCHGEPAPMALIRESLEIGHVLGEVPEGVDEVPLQRDLTAQQKSLRLKPSSEIRELNLDLRKPTDLGRSKLLHRLACLEIPWGTRGVAKASSGTFRESWELRWQPEMHIALIEANVHGNTVEAAAAGKLAGQAVEADLDALTRMLDQAVLADLPQAAKALLAHLQARAAVSADVGRMMRALGPLARVAKYSDVRSTSAADVLPILHGLFERVTVGLPGGCSQIDDDAARTLLEGINEAHAAVTLLDVPDQLEEWKQTLDRLANRGDAHGLLRGRATRLLVELGEVEEDDLGRRASLALSTAAEPADAAAWLEGLLRGSGLVLLHQQAIWQALDGWLRDLPEETFVGLLPLLRRGFADFSGSELLRMGEKVRSLGGPTTARPAPQVSLQLDHERAAGTLDVLRLILGGNE